MTKRKSATASKHARSPKSAAKAQRATQAVVRSPRERRLRAVETGSTNSGPERVNDTQPARLTENPATQQPNPVAENPAAAFERSMPDVISKSIPNTVSNRALDLYSATANARAYQAKLLEMTRANMQFAFEFPQKLATIRSPLEVPIVIAELTSKRIAMLQKFSKEMAELFTNGRTA
jgi:hypothetical protein